MSDRGRPRHPLLLITFTSPFILPNAIAFLGPLVYAYASACPFTSVAAILRRSYLCRILFTALHFSISLLAVFLNFAILVPSRTEGLLPVILASLISLTPLNGIAIINKESQKPVWNNVCDTFDDTIFLRAHGYVDPGISYAQFPLWMGGEQWRLFRSSRGYDFGPDMDDVRLKFDFVNETHILYTSTWESTFQGLDEVLSFAELGLYSEGSWIHACDWPSVILKNASGEVIIKSGPSWHRDLARMRVCAKKTAGKHAIAVVAGRILIANTWEVNRCCSYMEWDRCIMEKDKTIQYIKRPVERAPTRTIIISPSTTRIIDNHSI